MAKNAPNVTLTSNDLVLCNNSTIEAYFTGVPSGWTAGALGGGGGGTAREAIMSALGVDVNPQPTGTTYYLDNTHGSASDSNAGTDPSAPWLTIGKALTTLTAGDMVIGDGTYTHGSALLPSNSGTVGNPIIYRATTPRSFVVDQQSANDGFRLDSGSINYTVLDGLEIKNVAGPDGGGGVFTKDDNESIHVFNCYIHAIDCNSGGNCGGIRFDKQTNGVAYNNVIHTIRVGGANNNNAAGIHGYGHDGSILAFNKISDVSNGLDAKNSRTVNNWKLIGNDVDVTGDAVYVNVIGTGQPNVALIAAQVYNNLFRNGNVNLECYEHNPQSENLIFRNNVLLSKGVFIYEMENMQIYDNIFDFAGSASEAGVTITTERRDLYSAGRVCTVTYSDYNNFTQAPTFTTNRYAHDGGSEVKAMSLSTWQAQSAGDGYGTIQYTSPDANSHELSPNFDADYLTQNTTLLAGGRSGGQVGLEYQVGPDWSEV